MVPSLASSSAPCVVRGVRLGTRFGYGVVHLSSLRCATRPGRLHVHLALATSLAAALLQFSRSSSSSSSVPHAVEGTGTLKNGSIHSSSRLGLASSSRRSHARRHASTSAHASSSTEGAEFAHAHAHAQPPNLSSPSSDAAELSDLDDINALMRHPALMRNIKAPRHPIILCHGLYGFDVRGPFFGLEIHYWATVLDILREKVGAHVIVRGVPGTGAIADRALALHEYLCKPDAGVRGKPVNFVGHSMGGLDARYLISVLQPAPEQYTPVSLTCVNTPHRGSPFMDWCNANVGTGNDRVDEEIRKAKDTLNARSQIAEGWLPPASKAKLGGGDSLENFEKDVVTKIPFSLKTPLFVRPSAAEKEESGRKSQAAKSNLPSESLTEKLQDVTSKVVNRINETHPDSIDLSSIAPAGATSASSPSSTSPQPQTDAQSTNARREEGKAVKEKVKQGASSSLLNFGAFGRALSSISGSFSAYMLSVLDQPAYAMLSTRYMAQVFNPTVPDSPNVAYFSVAARKRSLPIYHPLWLPKLVLDAAAESRTTGGERDGSADALGSRSQGNDGLVSVESAKWGKFLGVVEDCDHWDLRGGGAPRWKGKASPQSNAEKAYPDHHKEGSGGKEVKNKDDSGWIDINKVVRTLFSASGGSHAEKEKGSKASVEAKKAEQDEKHSSWRDAISSVLPKDDGKKEKSKEEQGLIDEVASWISDRLPKGDKARRQQAERAADAQDEERTQQKQEGRHAGQAGVVFPVTSSTSEAEMKAIKTSVKLKREAAWQEELGHDEAARQLRRELAWHRAEWDRALASGTMPTTPSSMRSAAAATAKHGVYSSPPGHAAATSGADRRPFDGETRLDKTKEGRATSSISSAAELERFWVAICRHLWARGF